ncbi:MAG: hypothetical protein AAF518_15880 [Spirochaetota bacterium]
MTFYYEWKIENGMLYERLWDNRFSSWRSYSYEYIDANTIKIDGDTYEKSSF